MSKKVLCSVTGLGIIFLIIMTSVICGWTIGFDNFFYNLIISIRCDFFDNFFKMVTNFGDTYTIIGLVVGFLLVNRNKTGILYSVLAVDCTVTNLILKYLIRRDRPSVLRLVEQGGYSFPSGHSMISMAMYGMLICICYKNIKNRYLKWFLCIILSIIIFLVGVSRVYLGVHYISDVIGGFILSLMMIILYIELTNKYLGE